MSERFEPDLPDAADVFDEDDDGQLHFLGPYDDGLDFGSWLESMPSDDQYRSLSLAYRCRGRL